MNTTSHALHHAETMTRHAAGATVLRGVIAVLLGILALQRPNVAATVFVVVFAVFALVDGLLDLVLAERHGRAGFRWGWFAFEGIASLAIGVIALVYPGITFVALVLLVALRAMTLGILELIAAFSGQDVDSRWLLGLTGVLSIVLGILLLASPVAGGAAIIWMIGVYGIVMGAALFAVGLRMAMTARHEEQMHGPAAGTT
jgi:uncharacterized membrane protein HdeD (DUF308 family)